MISLLTSLAVVTVRMWTRVYTWRLPPSLRDERRAEIESDLWELQRDRGSALPATAQIISRWLLGIADDLAWRAAQRRPRARIGGIMVTTATITVAAVVAAAIWVLPALLPAKLPVPPNMMRFAAGPPPPPPDPPASRLPVR
jgi:hypothetical protein